MFLLGSKNLSVEIAIVFVSYIRRYVLTIILEFSDNKINYSFRLLYSEICSYCFLIEAQPLNTSTFSSPIFGDMFLLCLDQLVDVSTTIGIFNGTLNRQ